MKFSSRPATAQDMEFARRIHHRAYREVVERQFGHWDERRQDRFFESDWAGAEFRILLCDGVECGYAAIEDRPEDVHVRELVVDPDFQNKGIGTSVMNHALELARRRQVPVRLGTHHQNRARALYKRLGFYETESTETHIIMEWIPDRDSKEQ